MTDAPDPLGSSFQAAFADVIAPRPDDAARLDAMVTRAVAAAPESKLSSRRFASPTTLPTQTAVAALVLAPIIHVSFAPSVVPVLPMCGTPVPGSDAVAVPPPANVRCIA